MSRSDKDFYETPDAATYPIMAEAIQSGAAALWETVLDLGCGDGRLGLGANAAYQFAHTSEVRGDVYGIELDIERAAKAAENGFAYVYNGPLAEASFKTEPPPDLVVSNPPFSAALEFLEHAHIYREKAGSDVLFLLPVGYLGSQGRHAFWKAHPPDAMRVHSTRLSFTGDGKTANADYAWFYWGDGLDRGIDFYL